MKATHRVSRCMLQVCRAVCVCVCECMTNDESSQCKLCVRVWVGEVHFVCECMDVDERFLA